MKKLTTLAIAAVAALGAASLSAPATAKGFHGGGFKGGGFHRHHGHWGHRRHFGWGYGVYGIPVAYGGCFWKRSYYGPPMGGRFRLNAQRSVSLSSMRRLRA
jgi:hypothetical protein